MERSLESLFWSPGVTWCDTVWFQPKPVCGTLLVMHFRKGDGLGAPQLGESVRIQSVIGCGGVKHCGEHSSGLEASTF